MFSLGDHLSSLSGKLQDFTKVVNENIGSTLSPDGEVASRDNHIGELMQTCQEQKLKISQLISEKEELNDQHEEAINKLLSLKCKLTAENKRLAAQVLEHSKNCANSNEESSNSCYEYMKLDDLSTINMTNIDSLLKNINILTILVPLKNCHGDNILNDQILKLRKMKEILEREKHKAEPNYGDSVSKISNYIECLKFICEHKEQLLPFMKETALFVYNLHSDVMKLKGKSPLQDFKEQIASSNTGDQKNASIDASTVPSLKPIICVSQYCQTDVQWLVEHKKFKVAQSSYCQTDNVLGSNSCSQCEANKIVTSDLTSDICRLNEELSIATNDQESSVETITSSSQTTEICKCEELKFKLGEKTEELNDLVEKMHCKESELTYQLEQQVSLGKDFEQRLIGKEKVIDDKERLLSSHEQSMKSLKQQIDELQNKIACLNEQQNFQLQKSDISLHCAENESSFPHLVPVEKLQDQLTMSVSDNDKILLQQRLKALDLEKSRLLCVLNEKSQRCSVLESEIHRLTNIVASEKQALFKLQKDIQDLQDNKANSLDPDLTKEALQNLSRLVRDKDMEVEALKQKNDSLSEVIKQTCPGSEQIQVVIGERENLLKQINQYKINREKIMVSYNNKDQECRKQAQELKELTSDLESRSRELDVLQEKYSAVCQQYEEKQKAFINLQNEVILLKQYRSDLEQQQRDIKEKYTKLLNKVNSEITITISREELTSKEEEIVNLKVALKDKDNLINEKDCFIHELSQKVKSMKLISEELENTISNMKKTNELITCKLSESESAVQKAVAEKESLSQKLSDKQSELNLLREMNERLSMTVKEKEFYIQSLEEKITSLSTVIQGNVASSNSGFPMDIDQILVNSKEMYSKAQHFHRERDETLLALSQSQQESQELRSEIQKLKGNEEHFKNELDRLRKHLLQVEEHYTNEGLRAEMREKELRNRLAELEQTAKLSSTAVLDASHQANIQIASLQEQISIIASQRDRALDQLSELEDRVQQYAASVNNLQLVLEQMQKGHEKKMRESENKWKGKLSEISQQCLELQKLVDVKQIQLEETSQALEAASRLSEQLDAKEEIISNLKAELSKVEGKIKSSVQEINSMKSYSEGKVDRVIMKSLVLGYFSTPPGQKSEVVRLLARVLDFNQEEMAKAGIVVGRHSGTVEQKGVLSSFLGRLPLLNHTPVHRPLQSAQEYKPNTSTQSFATLFVKFLETESQPVVHMPLPAEKMALELTSKSHYNKNRPKAKLSTASPSKSPLLVGIDATFPSFTPVLAIENSSPAPCILQQVLD